MKQLLMLLSVAILASCNMAKFSTYPGEVQQTFPENMQGTYRVVMQSKTGFFSRPTASFNDTLLVSIGANGTSKINEQNSFRKLDSSYVLSLVQNKYYVLSTIDESSPTWWNCFVLVPFKQSLRVYPIVDDVGSSKVQSFFDAKFLTIANETDSVFGYTQQTESFIKYFESEIKSIGGIRLLKMGSENAK